MELHGIISVSETEEEEVYLLTLDATIQGERAEELFILRPEDPYGLAPAVRVALAEWVSGGNPIDPYVAPPPPPEPVPQIISRRQFYQGLATAEFITKQEAIDAIKGVALPTALQLIVDSLPDADERFSAEMLLLGTGEFQRDHALVTVFAAAQDLTETEVDDFWRLCALLN